MNSIHKKRCTQYLTGIITFKDDERLDRGKEISSELSEAIEGSRFFIVILSKNYANSTWCLDELAKIFEWMETKKRTVLFPVFYDVDPSEVRKQRGVYKKFFDKHEEDFSKEKVKRWRAALAQVASLSGWNLQDRSEAKLIKDIVHEIARKSNRTYSNVAGDLVGIDLRVKKLNAYLEPELDDVRFIGICGMGGIGKTTIARVVSEKLFYKYEGSCFLANVREVYEKRGLAHLQEMLISKILKETNLNICDHQEGITLIRRGLHRKKVLLVLDDVDKLEQLETLAGKLGWFGSGSRIIITTRDEHVLISHGINSIYKVEGLNYIEARNLLRMKAFKQKQPTDDHVKLLDSVIDYTKGLPLAVEVLGSFLCDRSVNEWKSAINRLRDIPNESILKILRISYDRLEKTDKKIFLDIACFFKGKEKNRVMEILNGFSFYPDIGLRVLIEKSLITISNNKLWMHDLIQEMGWEVVREQQPKEPGQWSRLWLNKDVYQVLTKNMGTQAIEGIIMLDMPKQGIALLDGNSFSTMTNLRLLKITSNVQFSQDLEYLSNELWFLKWKGYPLKSLPSSFHPEKLFYLSMCYSNIECLWKNIKHFEELKTMKLSYSCNLLKTPDFTGVPNLERLELGGCTRLVELHPSIGFLKRLAVLNLKNCKNLVRFATDISGLKSLNILNLYGCSKLEELPLNLEALECLEELDVGGTAIRQVPSSIVQLTNLKMLSFRGCQGQPPQTYWSSFLWSLLLPTRNPDCMGLVFPPLAGLCFLKTLDLSDCNLLEGAIPEDLGSLPSLEELNLSGNEFVSLPTSISQLLKLKILCLEKCQRLQSLPKLPPQIIFVGAEDCTSLETISSALELSTSRSLALHFFNCFKLVNNQGKNLAVTLLKRRLQELSGHYYQFHIRLPGTEIPAWFSHQSNASSSAEIRLSPNWLNDELLGVAVCAVFELPDDSDEVEIHCSMSMRTGGFDFSFAVPRFMTIESDHLWLGYLSRKSFECCGVKWTRTSSTGGRCIGASFGLSSQGRKDMNSLVKKCGIRLVYKPDVQHFEGSEAEGANTMADDEQQNNDMYDWEWSWFTEITMPSILERSSIRNLYSSRRRRKFDVR